MQMIYFLNVVYKKTIARRSTDKNILKKYDVDNMAEKRGFKVLRFSLYYCYFNPIEMI